MDAFSVVGQECGSFSVVGQECRSFSVVGREYGSLFQWSGGNTGSFSIARRESVCVCVCGGGGELFQLSGGNANQLFLLWTCVYFIDKFVP